MKTKVYKGILEDEALQLASKEFGISEDDLVVKVENDEVEVTVGIDGIEKGKQYIQSILKCNNVNGMIEKRVRDNVVELNIEAGDFNGVLIVMVLLSLLATILFSIIGVEHSLLWGRIIGITNIIPYIGPYIGGAIVVAFTLLTSYKKALIVLVIIVLLQLIESNFITPNIHSKTMKTSPILVLLFISIFGQIMGIFGMIIAIPFLSIFQILVNKIPLLKN